MTQRTTRKSRRCDEKQKYIKKVKDPHAKEQTKTRIGKPWEKKAVNQTNDSSTISQRSEHYYGRKYAGHGFDRKPPKTKGFVLLDMLDVNTFSSIDQDVIIVVLMKKDISPYFCRMISSCTKTLETSGWRAKVYAHCWCPTGTAALKSVL